MEAPDPYLMAEAEKIAADIEGGGDPIQHKKATKRTASAPVNMTDVEAASPIVPSDASGAFTLFRSRQSEATLFNIKLGTKKYRGYWVEGREKVEWRVPNADADAIRSHHFFTSQRIIEV